MYIYFYPYCSEIGKHGQSVPTRKKLCHHLSEWQQLKSDSSNEVTGFQAVAKNALLVTYKQVLEIHRPFVKGSLIIPIIVNSRSRIFLLHCCMLLEEAGYIIMYCDTDSILYLPKAFDLIPVSQIIPINEFKMGAYKFEILNGIMSCIYARKNYTIQKEDLTLLMKAKGLCNTLELLSQNDQLQVCSHELVNLLLYSDTIPRAITFEQRRFVLDARRFTVTKKITLKKFRVVGPRRLVFIQQVLSESVDASDSVHEQNLVIRFIDEDFHPPDQYTDTVPQIPSLFFRLAPIILTYPVGMSYTDTFVTDLENSLCVGNRK